MERATKEENTSLKKNRSKFLKVFSSSGYKTAVEELLSNTEVMSQLSTVRAVDEVRALRTFCDMMNSDPDRACYGLQDVLRANEHLAIDELLISDRMYRCNNFEERNKYMDLIDSVRSTNGKVFLFSSLHVSGEQLNNYTGIAATLRFPLPDVDEGDGTDSTSTQGTTHAPTMQEKKQVEEKIIEEDIFNFL
jgi:protein pelota